MNYRKILLCNNVNSLREIKLTNSYYGSYRSGGAIVYNNSYLEMNGQPNSNIFLLFQRYFFLLRMCMVSLLVKKRKITIPFHAIICTSIIDDLYHTFDLCVVFLDTEFATYSSIYTATKTSQNRMHKNYLGCG